MKILLCDDRDQQREEARQSLFQTLGPDHEIVAWDTDKLTKDVVSFFDKVKNLLNGTDSGPLESDFDGFDLILLDNNLSALAISGTRLTAEAIAGYLRAFSNSPYIISLNKNPYVDFDLRFLIGDYSTRSDFAAKTEHLSSRWLWFGDFGEPGSFQPWYWPTLATAPDQRRNQINFVQRNLDNPILPALGFSEASVRLLSRHAEGALSPSAGQGGDSHDKPPSSVTFREFFEFSNRSIPVKEDRDKLLAHKLDEVIARIVAAEIDVWLKRDVIGPQSALVDAPHLLARMPFLLANKATDIDAWNASARSRTPPFGFDQALYDKHIAAAVFSDECWAPKPLFWWSILEADDGLQSLLYEDGGEWGDFVFCEDLSSFRPRKSEGGSPKEFAAEFEGEWNRRYVALVDGFHYSPHSRFAL
ncbi:hypothetical protein [Rhodoligotrophos defluvii]|uniref:hypothetical protein n=1 Tax=Rhodoligotrophos defluvii TaxID=2561934 RepID=UPI0010C9F9D2|nr:hypothetical protein [Rhodoligotrophos defluvii]